MPTDTTESPEIVDRETRLRALMDAHGLDAVLLRRVSSFAWATAGAASYVNTATDAGVGALLVTREARYVLTNTIEAPRFERELGLAAQGWQLVAEPWWQTGEALARLTRGLRLGADAPVAGATDLSAALSRERSRLTPPEGARMRALCRDAAAAMDAAIRSVRPGQSEHQIAARIAAEAAARGAWPVVDLVATDARVSAYRHPLPTDKTLERYALLVLCARRAGLVCALTRCVHFGRLPDELRRKQAATAAVDATLMAATRPGATLGEVFARGVARYAREGFAEEWKLHHQGGAVGYESREFLAGPDGRDVVVAGQCYAWNPSITGAKSEDTIAVGAQGNDVLTAIAGWPTTRIEIDGASFDRPVVLEIT